MCIGFILGTLTMVYAAIIQWRVYKTSPCGNYATDCELGVSPVSLWAQIPLFGVPAIGEIFINVTSCEFSSLFPAFGVELGKTDLTRVILDELAYTRAPARMKALVYAIVRLSFLKVCRIKS